MTKREYLESLGYRYYKEEDMYKKILSNKFNDFIAYIDLNFNDFYVVSDTIYSQRDIDFTQIAFNNVKRDFDEMQKYGD